MIKVLIADDSITFRTWLRGVFAEDDAFTVVGEAISGTTAIAQITSLHPDVVVLDNLMPEMNGIDVTKRVMSSFPVAIVMLSGTPLTDSSGGLGDAIGAGALFFFQKPDAPEILDKWKRDFLRTCRAASRVPLVKRRETSKVVGKNDSLRGPLSLVAIGASTGGPQTIANILGALPRLPVPVVIVVHADEGLPAQLQTWFNRVANAPVEVVNDRTSIDIKEPKIFLAPSGKHLVLNGRQLRLIDQPPVNFCKPSIDVFFSSLTPLKEKVLAIVLTGMGRDGAEGLKKVRDSGGVTIAQDEASSIIFGMPKAAIELGGAETVLAANKIAGAISEMFAVVEDTV